MSSYVRIAETLLNLGFLDQYLAKFKENEIEDTTMDSLVMRDQAPCPSVMLCFREVVPPAGHRMKILSEFTKVTSVAGIPSDQHDTKTKILSSLTTTKSSDNTTREFQQSSTHPATVNESSLPLNEPTTNQCEKEAESDAVVPDVTRGCRPMTMKFSASVLKCSPSTTSSNSVAILVSDSEVGGAGGDDGEPNNFSCCGSSDADDQVRSELNQPAAATSVVDINSGCILTNLTPHFDSSESLTVLVPQSDASTLIIPLPFGKPPTNFTTEFQQTENQTTSPLAVALLESSSTENCHSSSFRSANTNATNGAAMPVSGQEVRDGDSFEFKLLGDVQVHGELWSISQPISQPTDATSILNANPGNILKPHSHECDDSTVPISTAEIMSATAMEYVDTAAPPDANSDSVSEAAEPHSESVANSDSITPSSSGSSSSPRSVTAGPVDVDFRGCKHNFRMDESLHTSQRQARINISSNEEVDGYQPFAYRIGSIMLKLCPIPELSTVSFNKGEIQLAFPGLQHIILYPNPPPNLSTILLKLKRDPDDKFYLGLKRNRRKASDNYKHFYFRLEPLDTPCSFFSYGGLGGRKTFELKMLSHDLDSNELNIGVNLLDSAILGEHELKDVATARPRQGTKLIIEVFNYFFQVSGNGSTVADDVIEQKDFDSFYREIKLYHDAETIQDPSFSIQHPNLIPSLRDYQRDAVKWMLSREGAIADSLVDPHSPDDPFSIFIRSMYVSIENKLTPDSDNSPALLRNAYYNHVFGFVTWFRPSKPSIPTGGILADEMGLGKTVETLALILCNSRGRPTYSGANQQQLIRVLKRRRGCVKAPDRPASKKPKTQPKLCEFVTQVVHPPSHGVQAQALADSYETTIQDVSKSTVGVSNPVIPGISNSMDSAGAGTSLPQPSTNREEVVASFNAQNLLEIKTTLIVTPPAIIRQWIEEIQRHVRNCNIKMLIYEGAGTHRDGGVTPSKLSEYDIVLTTYTTLGMELGFADQDDLFDPDDPSVQVKFKSPLVGVQWWRVCLDEAQMVENISTKMSCMASKLQTVHRWCITGTPINIGLIDLYGLVSFLDVHAISIPIFWNMVVEKSFRNGNMSILGEVFGPIFWRNSKSDVENELNLPEQKEFIHWLEFTPPEARAYGLAIADCKEKFMKALDRLKRKSELCMTIPLSFLDKATTNDVLTPLINLRKSCCHPHPGKSTELRDWQKGLLSLTETCDKQIKRSKDDLMEAHHYSLSALNGKGDVQKLSDNLEGATTTYREVMSLAEVIKPIQNMDSLQVLHAMVNLEEILRDPMRLAFLGEVRLSQRISDFKQEYVTRHETQLAASSESLQTVSKKVENYFDALTSSGSESTWWALALDVAASNEAKQEELLSTIEQTLVVGNSDIELAMKDRCGSVAGLKEVIDERLLCLKSMRSKFLNSLQEQVKHRRSEILAEAKKKCNHLGIPTPPCKCVRCTQLRRCPCKTKKCAECNKIRKPVDCRLLTYCSVCALDIPFWDYERCLYSDNLLDRVFVCHVSRIPRDRRQFALEEEIEVPESVQLERDKRQSRTRKDSAVEFILGVILRWTQRSSQFNQILEKGRIHLKLFEELKNEFRLMSKVRQQIYDNVSALYEMEVSPAPANLRFSDNVSSLVLAEKFMATHCKLKGAFENYLNQYKYWQALKEESKLSTDATIFSCDICSTSSIFQKCFLPCGHSFCYDRCLKEFYKISDKNIVCPYCRNPYGIGNVMFVNSRLPFVRGEKKIVGENSTKMYGIIRALIELEESHKGEKILIFSEWDHVLKLLSPSLNQNGIPHLLLRGTEINFHQLLKQFKERDDVRVLLMLLGSGSKGLNIVEATHVFLVEPTLKLASENQAIGRIHRMGQTRPTFVHRFYIRNSIEEKLFRLLQNRRASTASEDTAMDEFLVKDLYELVAKTDEK